MWWSSLWWWSCRNSMSDIYSKHSWKCIPIKGVRQPCLYECHRVLALCSLGDTNRLHIIPAMAVFHILQSEATDWQPLQKNVRYIQSSSSVLRCPSKAEVCSPSFCMSCLTSEISIFMHFTSPVISAMDELHMVTVAKIFLRVGSGSFPGLLRSHHYIGSMVLCAHMWDGSEIREQQGGSIQVSQIISQGHWAVDESPVLDMADQQYPQQDGAQTAAADGECPRAAQGRMAVLSTGLGWS